MAVPASGTLSMQDIAQERLNNTYGSGSVTGPISMYNLINGGNTGGAVTSGNTYPALNTGCDPNPSNTGYTYFTCQDVSSPYTVYGVWFTGSLANFGAGDTVYRDNGGNSTLAAGQYWVTAASGGINYRSFFTCSASDLECPNFTVNSSGVITAVGCGCP